MNPGHFGYGPRKSRRTSAASASAAATTEHAWTEATTKRVAAGLLKIAADFGLLRGGTVKEFASYHLPERSFLYLLHAMLDDKQSPARSSQRPTGASS